MSTRYATTTDDYGKGAVTLIVGGVAAVVLLALLLLSVKIVPAGEVGVVTNWGAVQQGTLDPGLHLVLPIMQGVHKINTQVQAHQFQQIDAASQELQQVTLTGKVNYRVDAQRASDLYQNVGTDFADKLLDPAFNDYIKTIVPTYSVNDILKNRDAIRDATQQRLEATVSPYGIHIVAVQIVDIHFSKEFETAIEAKQVAQQQVQTQQQVLEQKKIQAEQAVVDAQGQAKANAILTASLTQLIIQNRQLAIQQQMLDKWDGKLPTYLGSSNVFVPFKGQ